MLTISAEVLLEYGRETYVWSLSHCSKNKREHLNCRSQTSIRQGEDGGYYRLSIHQHFRLSHVCHVCVLSVKLLSVPGHGSVANVAGWWPLLLFPHGVWRTAGWINSHHYCFWTVGLMKVWSTQTDDDDEEEFPLFPVWAACIGVWLYVIHGHFPLSVVSTMTHHQHTAGTVTPFL